MPIFPKNTFRVKQAEFQCTNALRRLPILTRSVMFRMNLSTDTVKSRAAQLGILNFTVRPEEVRFTFGADAPLDGAKLFAAVGTIDGAAFAAGEKIALVIKNKHKTGEEMFRIAQDAVNTLLLCTENAG